MSHSPINILRLDHVVLRVTEFDAVLSFYRDVLGCPPEVMREDIGLYQLRAGDSLIDIVDVNGPLGQQHPLPPAAGAPNMDHLCVQVDPWDEHAIRAHLHAHGIECGDVESRYGAAGMGPSLYICDPAGNTVELKGPPEN